jgi:ferrous iron transport protein B
VAKEVFVSQLAIVYAVGGGEEPNATLREQLKANYTPLTGFCVMLFCLIYAPCIATIAMTKQETGSWAWAMFQLFGLTVLAYVVTLAVYQVGSLFY